jgi:hypothetical protein
MLHKAIIPGAPRFRLAKSPLRLSSGQSAADASVPTPIRPLARSSRLAPVSWRNARPSLLKQAPSHGKRVY